MGLKARLEIRGFCKDSQGFELQPGHIGVFWLGSARVSSGEGARSLSNLPHRVKVLDSSISLDFEHPVLVIG